jgi:hypothetical protein
MAKLPISRPISEQEALVVAKMLEVFPTAAAGQLDLDSIKKLKVVARCDCGCDTVEFQGIDWSMPPAVVADGRGKTKKNDEVGVLIFANGPAVTCLEVYQLGEELARLPTIESIVLYGSAV